MPAHAGASHRRNNLLQSQGFVGAAARFWQASTVLSEPACCEVPKTDHDSSAPMPPTMSALRSLLRRGSLYAENRGPLWKALLTSQIQFFAEPFHRMFSLDNLAIQYPHAEVERVPVRSSRLHSPIIPFGG